jgi:serine/threonine protein kinase
MSTQIRVADFGLAQRIKCSPSGSLAFNSPERLLGYSLDFPDDIWAFGCTLFELSFGVLPFFPVGKLSESVLSKAINIVKVFS